jgi:outer membrane protein TolC
MRKEALCVISNQVEAGTANRSALLAAQAALSAAEADLWQAELGRSTAVAELRRLVGTM